MYLFKGGLVDLIPMNVIVQGGLVDLIPMNVMVQGGLVDLIPTSTTRLFFHIFTFIFCGRRGTFWHRPSFCVAGVALLYMDCPFTWQAWDFMTWLKRVKFSYEAFFCVGLALERVFLPKSRTCQ